MRFVDASVFAHAYLRPKRALTAEEIQIKEDARKIVGRLNQGESVCTSVVQLAEIANLLEDYLPREKALEIERAICFKDTIEIDLVNRMDCSQALSEAEERNIGLTDAIAFVLMERKGLTEIYSFDHDFDRVTGIKRIRK
jgi:uncharacterized protein